MPTIVVPYRDDGHRADNCRAVCAALRLMVPGAPLLLADSGHEPFNRAASRNLGIQQVAAGDFVVVCDADTLPDRQGLATALVRAYDGRLHYPYSLCHYLTEAGTAEVLAGQQPDPMRIEFSIPSAQGGCMVMRAECWRDVGGMNGEFEAWGYEDNEFYVRVSRTIGPPIHHPGLAWHLWHPHDRNQGTPEQTRNFLMARRAIDEYPPTA